MQYTSNRKNANNYNIFSYFHFSRKRKKRGKKKLRREHLSLIGIWTLGIIQIYKQEVSTIIWRKRKTGMRLNFYTYYTNI